jgi:hypothetical protein
VRSTCRWWMQEGRAACTRCPQVVTADHAPTDAMTKVSDPAYRLTGT